MAADRFQQRIEAGQSAFGVLLNYPSPEIVEALGHLGFDWVSIDAEHGPLTLETCDHLVRAAQAAGITPFVHVPSHEPWELNRYLNTGASGLLVPHVASKATAETIVSAAKFAPIGTRGSGSITRAAGYGVRWSPAEYAARANAETRLFGLLEDAEALESTAELVGVAGFDGFVVGPGDLSNALGVPGQVSHPRVVEAVDRLSAAVLAAGKLLCRILRNPDTALDDARGLMDQGVQMITLPFSLVLIRGARDLVGLR